MRLRLELQHGRLIDWGDAAGITETCDQITKIFKKRMEVNGPVIFALLGEMHALLKKMRKFYLRYDDSVEPLVVSTGETRKQPVDIVNMKAYQSIFESKDIPRDRRKYPKGLSHIVELAIGAKDIVRHPKRLLWAVKNEQEFQKALARMTELTDHLHETLGDAQMRTLLETCQATMLAVLQLAQRPEQIKAVRELPSTPNVPAGGDSDSASIFSQAETLVEGRSSPSVPPSTTSNIFERLAAFRSIHTSLYGRQASDPPPVPLIDLNHDISDIKSTEVATRDLASYGGHDVWIEWKEYKCDEEIPTETDFIYSVSDKVKKDAERLVALLRTSEKPAEFCVPNCRGYINDEKKNCFGFVFENPKKSAPVSLLKLLGKESRASTPFPLNERVALAQRLATCLLFLHATNWLHKSLRSASVLFLSGTGTPTLSHPYISSFEYARPDVNKATYIGAPETPEWAIYCHPDYIGRPGNFRKTYDIYSLGIILIEIAHWKSAAEIFSIADKVNSTSNDMATKGDSDEEPSTAKGHGHEAPSSADKLPPSYQIRKWLTEDIEQGGRPDILDTVGTNMGERYLSAVKACIGGMEYFHLPKDVDQTDPIIATLLQHAYLRLVVDVLHAIVV